MTELTGSLGLLVDALTILGLTLTPEPLLWEGDQA